jgi:hypothetical protein
MDHDLKEREIALKEKELEQKEKQLEQKEKELQDREQTADLASLAFLFSSTKAEPIYSMRKTHQYLVMLHGEDWFKPVPSTVDELCQHLGKTKEQFLAGPINEIFAEMNAKPPKQTWLEIVHETLDIIFQQRYGWPEGTAKTKSIVELRIALENALEYDAEGRPSVWKMTSAR